MALGKKTGGRKLGSRNKDPYLSDLQRQQYLEKINNIVKIATVRDDKADFSSVSFSSGETFLLKVYLKLLSL